MVLLDETVRDVTQNRTVCICGHPEVDHLDAHPQDGLSWCTWPGCGCAYFDRTSR